MLARTQEWRSSGLQLSDISDMLWCPHFGRIQKGGGLVDHLVDHLILLLLLLLLLLLPLIGVLVILHVV